MLHATARLPGVTLTLPTDFHLLPLETDLAARVAAQTELLDQLPMAAGDRREMVALYLEGLATRLRAVGIAAAAFCAVRVDDHASTATLTVGFHETATTDRTLALLGTATTLRRGGTVSDVETTTFARQPAVVWTVDLPAEQPAGVSTRELQVLVQAPDVPVAVLVTLATPTLQDWPLYERVMREICETLCFTPAVTPEQGAEAQVLLLPSTTG